MKIKKAQKDSESTLESERRILCQNQEQII